MSHPWLAERTAQFDSSGIRKVFDLAAKMKDPINLSIGQPDFPVPDADQARPPSRRSTPTRTATARRRASRRCASSCKPTVDATYGHDDRRVLVTCGTSGALVLAMLALVDPGDEVIIFDPYFVMYPALVAMVGGKAVYVDTYPDFRIDLDKVDAAITPRTKLILFNSPANPTGVVADEADARGLPSWPPSTTSRCSATKSTACSATTPPCPRPREWNPDTIVVDGFSKSYGVTGWRLGWVHGPAAIIDKMTMLQQYTFVCAPHPLQWAAVAALDVDMSAAGRRLRPPARPASIAGLRDAGYRSRAHGRRVLRVPRSARGRGTGQEFVARAIENELLVIPGGIFSRRDTHFRISYAASERTLERGLEVLRRLANDVTHE